MFIVHRLAKARRAVGSRKTGKDQGEQRKRKKQKEKEQQEEQQQEQQQVQQRAALPVREVCGVLFRHSCRAVIPSGGSWDDRHTRAVNRGVHERESRSAGIFPSNPCALYLASHGRRLLGKRKR